MRIKSTFGLLLALISACHPGKEENTTANGQSILSSDTVVVRKMIREEIAGSAYRKRATGYSLITNSDTSDFVCIFSESKEGGKVSMLLRYEKGTMTYGQRMLELRNILLEAKRDYNFDSLKSVYLGRLILSGDLAVDVTKQYVQRFGDTGSPGDIATVSQFLKESKLATDLNQLLNPSSISVYKISPEKLFFASKKELLRASKVETDVASIPEKILDCLVWVELGRNSSQTK